MEFGAIAMYTVKMGYFIAYRLTRPIYPVGLDMEPGQAQMRLMGKKGRIQSAVLKLGGEFVIGKLSMPFHGYVV